jgi:hypothetical protein
MTEQLYPDPDPVKTSSKQKATNFFSAELFEVI